MDERALALVKLLISEDGMSIHKACKQLGLSMSEMMRLLTELDALSLIERREQRGRECLFLSSTGRAICADLQ